MKLTKKQYEQLPDFMKDMFTKGEDGDYVSKDTEDAGALKIAKELEEELKAYKEKEDKDTEAQAKKEGDFSKLEEKWKKKYEKDISAKDNEINTLNSEISSLVLDTTAKSLAESISTVPDLMVDILKKRLSLDRENGKPIARVLDADGKVSHLTLEDLKTEFSENPKYSAIMIASKASGGSKPCEQPGPASGGSYTKSSNLAR